MSFIKWLLTPFAWQTVKDTGHNRYQVNGITGKRRVLCAFEGYQPVDRHWLRTGKWSRGPKRGPRGRRR